MKVYNFQSFCFVLILFYIGFLSTGSLSLFSSLLLCRIIDIACCIAMVLISLKVCLIVFSGILNFSSKIFIEEMCAIDSYKLLVITIICVFLYQCNIKLYNWIYSY